MNVDRRAVLAGATVAGFVATVAIVLAQVVKTVGDRDASLPLYFVLLGGFVVGGMLAARRRPESPLTHGALAALAGYAAVIVALVVIRLALGRALPAPASVVFDGLMAASAGILGGYLAARGAALTG